MRGGQQVGFYDAENPEKQDTSTLFFDRYNQ